MNFPLQVGWPQVCLLLIAAIGIALLISSVLSLGRRRMHTYKDEDGVVRTHSRRHFRFGRGLGGILLLVVAILLLWVSTLVQSYLGLTGEIKVAHVHATSIANAPHQMSVDVTLYDGNGHVASDNSYLVQGDEWMVQGDIVKFPAWLNVVGLHSGYKLTRLEGRFDDPNMERTAQHTVVELNGGDDNFFKTTHTQKAWFGPFVDAAYGNAVFQAGGTFDVFATQDALIARPTP